MTAPLIPSIPAIDQVYYETGSKNWSEGIKAHDNMPPKLNREIISAAITGYEHQKQQIDTRIAELRAMLPGGSTEAATSEPATRKRRRLSAAARKRIGDAQRRRWAAARGEYETAAAPEPAKRKRKLSAKGRAAIVAATKRRWALNRAEAAKAKTATTKKTAQKKAPIKKAAVKRPPAKKAAKKTAPVKKTTKKAAVTKTAAAPAPAAAESAG